MNTYTETRVKCPKCKSNDLSLHEHWEGHGISWQQVSGKINRQDGVLEPGDPQKVFAECDSCGYCWTVRGANQITDVLKDSK